MEKEITKNYFIIFTTLLFFLFSFITINFFNNKKNVIYTFAESEIYNDVESYNVSYLDTFSDSVEDLINMDLWDLTESNLTIETDDFEDNNNYESGLNLNDENHDIETNNFYIANNGYKNANDEKNADTVPSRNYTVVIDPGHGGTDPGSIGYKTKVKESDLNLKMSFKLKEKLESACINVVMTREDEGSLAEGSGKGFKKKDMQLRKDLIKKVRPNMVISLHQNSYTNHKLRGAQVFYDKTSDISKKIAEFIQEEFLAGLEHSNKTTSPGDYFMLKCTTAPSVIVECGFLSNEEDEKLLLQDEYQDKIIDCVYRGIVKFLQINQ